MRIPEISTRIEKVDSVLPLGGIIQQAADLILAGRLVAFPTETVYGLGANALNEDAVKKIFEAKGRPAKNPLIVHVYNVEQAKSLVTNWPESAEKLANRFWPGPLTLVLPRQAIIPNIVTGNGPTVAIRCPIHPVARKLLQQANVPIAAPSANRSSELSPTRAEHVYESLRGRIDLILDGGPTPNGIESTVLDLSGEAPRLLRPGPIPPKELEAIIGPILRTNSESEEHGTLPSPGMLSRHYAPGTPLSLFHNRKAVSQFVPQKKIGILSFGSMQDFLFEDAILIEMPMVASEYASRLYAELHALDAMNLSHIWVELPPETDEWLAIRDRLQRAATRQNGKN